jgi:hypothetical protein
MDTGTSGTDDDHESESSRSSNDHTADQEAEPEADV